MPASRGNDKEAKLSQAVKQLETTIRELSEQHARLHHPLRSLELYFMRGVLYGFGIIFAFAVAIPLFIKVLGYIEIVPLVGDFMVDIAERMEQARQIQIR